jgi:hypothetical protein
MDTVRGGEILACGTCSYSVTSRFLCFCHSATFQNLRSFNNHIRQNSSNSTALRPLHNSDFDYHVPNYDDVLPDVPPITHSPPDNAGATPSTGWRHWLDNAPSFETCPNLDRPTLSSHFTTGDGRLLSTTTRKYIFNELTNPGGGACRIVASAFSQNTTSHNIPSDQLPSLAEVDYHLKMTSFLLSLTETQVSEFSHLLEKTVTNAIEMGGNPERRSSLFSSGCTRLPSSIDDLNCYYLTKPTAISKNIPSPEVLKDDSHYAISDIYDVTQHFLLWDDIPDFLHPSHFNGITPHRMIEVVEEVSKVCPHYKPLIIPFNEWKDKFEGSTTKKNRSSVHATTATFAFGKSTAHTSPLSIGLGSQDINSCDRRLSFNYRRLFGRFTWFYSKQHASIIPVYLVPYAAIQDRVEFSTFAHVLSHSSPIARRRYWIAHINLSQSLPCKPCHIGRLQRVSNQSHHPSFTSASSQSCECMDLDFEDVPTRLCRPLADDFPNDPCSCGSCPPQPAYAAIPIPNRTIFPFRLTFDNLSQCLRYAIHRRLRGWTKTSTEKYLKACGINSVVHENLERTFQFLIKNNNDPLDELCLEDIFSIVCPPAWDRSIPISYFTDAMMHLLKGLGEDVFVACSFALKKVYRNAPCLSLLNFWLEDVKDLQLQWLKVLHLSGKKQDTLGGWVSENYIAFSRIHSFIYEQVLHTISMTSPAQKQVRKDILIYLFLHRCVSSRLLASDMHVRHNEMYAEETGHYIKLFLFQTAVMDEYAPKKTSWTNKANPISLLNCVHTISRFGSSRNNWDGDREAYVGYMKPYLWNIRSSDNYFKTKLEHIHLKTALSGLIRNNTSNDTSGDNSLRYSAVHRVYPNLESIGIFQNKSVRACSAFLVQSTKTVYVAYRCGSRRRMRQLHVNWDSSSKPATEFGAHVVNKCWLGESSYDLVEDRTGTTGIVFLHSIIGMATTDNSIWCWSFLQEWMDTNNGMFPSIPLDIQSFIPYNTPTNSDDTFEDEPFIAEDHNLTDNDGFLLSNEQIEDSLRAGAGIV